MGDIATVFDGPHATPKKTESGPWYLSISSLKQGRFDFAASAHLSSVDLPRWTKRVMPMPGDTLFSYETRLGDAAYWRHSFDSALGRRMGLLRPDPERVDPGFLSYVFLGPEFQDVIRQKTLSGSTVDRIPVGDIPAWPVRLPGLAYQRVVAQILGSIDDLIENNKRRVEVLEEMARVIYREWFVHFRYPDHETVPLVDSLLGPIPEGWSWATVDDLVGVAKETLDPSLLDPATPAVGLEHIPRKQITLDDWGRAGDLGSRKATFKKGDILFGKIRPYFHKVSVAAIDGICSTDAIVIRPKPVHWGEAVAVIASDEFVAHATQTSNGTKMPRADWKVIGKYPVVVPPTSISSNFTQVIRDHLDLADRLMFESRRLAEMRDLLLPKLVTGQFDVSTLDLDGLLEGAVA